MASITLTLLTAPSAGHVRAFARQTPVAPSSSPDTASTLPSSPTTISLASTSKAKSYWSSPANPRPTIPTRSSWARSTPITPSTGTRSKSYANKASPESLWFRIESLVQSSQSPQAPSAPPAAHPMHWPVKCGTSPSSPSNGTLPTNSSPPAERPSTHFSPRSIVPHTPIPSRSQPPPYASPRHSRGFRLARAAT